MPVPFCPQALGAMMMYYLFRNYSIFWGPPSVRVKPRRYEGFYISTGSKIFFQTLVFWFLESKM